jgi:CheY-like chemotaxis protein
VRNYTECGATILVVADDAEIRDGIETLLLTDGYLVDPARNEREAIAAAILGQPNLILVSLDQPCAEVAASARRIRAGGGLQANVPIVMFCVLTVAEGTEMAVGEDTYATWPANFNQLRGLMSRLLDAPTPRGEVPPLPGVQ